MIIFSTSRLVVRKLCKSDLNFLHQIYGDEQVMSQIPLQVLSLEETKVELDRIINAYNSNSHPLSVWGVYTQELDQFVGVCASIRISSRCRDIGYRIKSTLWGNGYGTEIAEGIIDYLKSDAEVKIIQASVDVRNIASINILKKFMKFIKKEYDPKNNSWSSHYELFNQN